MSEPTLSSLADGIGPSQLARRAFRRPSRECRAWVRFPFDAKIAFQPLELRKDGIWRRARIRDISTKGLGLILDTQVQGGAILAIKLEGPCQRLDRPLLARVMRRAEQSSGGWQVGCTFAIPLGEHELHALVPPEDPAEAAADSEPSAHSPQKVIQSTLPFDPFFQGSSDERRTYPRRRIMVPVLLSCALATGESSIDREALATDASGGGMKLLAQECLGRGTLVRMRSAKAPPSASVEVRVKSCSPHQTKWSLGVQFLQTPPSEFMLFFR
jgi:hypothetical protein